MKNYRVVSSYVGRILNKPIMIEAKDEQSARQLLDIMAVNLQEFEILSLEELDDYQIPMMIDDYDDSEEEQVDNIIPFNKNKLN